MAVMDMDLKEGAEFMNRKVAYDVTDFAPKKVTDKKLNLCWRGIGPTPTFGVILKTNEK